MFSKKYNDIIAIENLVVAWERFLSGKRHKKDVIVFEAGLADNVASLYYDLQSRAYKHGPYSAFNISDPKPRNIHKATVRDRLLHHIIYGELYSYDDKAYLKNILAEIESFLGEKLHLSLHPNKVSIKTYASGVDFLGWVHFPYHRQIRTSTKKKIIRNTAYFPKPQTVNSYRGLLLHGNTYEVKKAVGIAVDLD